MNDRKRPRTQPAQVGGHRMQRMRQASLKPPLHHDARQQSGKDVVLDCGWGRLLFGQTFDDAQTVADAMRAEGPGRRDIAFYVRSPQVLLAAAPSELFLDPSHTYRLDLSTYRTAGEMPRGFFTRRLSSAQDAEDVNRIYVARDMLTVRPEFFWSHRDSRAITYFVIEDEANGSVIGSVMGVNHSIAFGDPENGSSLWCLAVDPQASQPGIGEALVRRLAEHFKARGASYMDLSVIHDNEQAIALYEKLGFTRVPMFAVKRKNQINEELFTEGQDDEAFNPYAQIIISEARRRGIGVEVIDTEGGFFRLIYGGRSFVCRESLTELTSATALSICDDKQVTRRIVSRAGVRVPAEISASDEKELSAFLDAHGSVVVKPARGEQGKGVCVGLKTMDDVRTAIAEAQQICNVVIVEECVEGVDLRIIVIDYRVVAGAIRKPPRVSGNGRDSVRGLIERQSRRRSAATGGESTIPMDDETVRCVADAGFSLDDVLPNEESITIRKTANLHTGGTIHDVTELLHPTLIDAAVKVARAVEIPVTGVDFIVTSPSEPDYWFIEANERPGLANHEPQPTAERFIDLLFPLSMPAPIRASVQP